MNSKSLNERARLESRGPVFKFVLLAIHFMRIIYGQLRPVDPTIMISSVFSILKKAVIYLAAVPSWEAMSLRLLGHWSKSADLALGILAGVMPGTRVAEGWA